MSLFGKFSAIFSFISLVLAVVFLFLGFTEDPSWFLASASWSVSAFVWAINGMLAPRSVK